MSLNDVIIAQSTPVGSGAIALVRMSGSQSVELADSLSLLMNGKKLSDLPSHTVHLGWVVDKHGEHLDQVLFILLKAPRTFTGEDTVEISCHNNPFIIESIIQRALELGARLAGRGEFTRRAFENGKINLVQAEAINELICAQTELAIKNSLAQMDGSLSQWITDIESSLLKALAWCEASFEFLEHEGDFAVQITTMLHDILHKIADARKSFDMRTQIRQGVRIALVGSVNAGKSSLFNRLLNQQRSIVTAIAGTTRDTIEAGLFRNGTFWTLIDTAGIRETDDVIEQEGVKRSLQEVEKADVVLLVIDGSTVLSPDSIRIYEHMLSNAGSKIILVKNKADLPQAPLSEKFDKTLPISSVTGFGCDILEKQLEKKVADLIGAAQVPFMINQRHMNLLVVLEHQVSQILELLSQNMVHYELVSYHLREALEGSSQLTGKSVSEAALDSVFNEFCVGK
ncbi:TPA: tRNA uridine-5-carboxymethylaminomethyl(34) synthesis GTPase MnmE [Candidatus Dependentiae bacterium]|nr:tRNA uridine-5-carboxymethylaminomethyl(34) synthesis GTPase MnmE [Candidatus Dependentiae bacterium]